MGTPSGRRGDRRGLNQPGVAAPPTERWQGGVPTITRVVLRLQPCSHLQAPSHGRHMAGRVESELLEPEGR